MKNDNVGYGINVCVCWHAYVTNDNVWPWHLNFFIIDAEGVFVGVCPDWLWCHADGQHGD